MAKTKTEETGNGADAPAASEQAEQGIRLQRIEQRTLIIEIRGVSPLIVHRFSEKAKAKMLEAQTTRTRARKEPKVPEEDYHAARYIMPGGSREAGPDGFPAVGFKAAMVGAGRLFDGVTMTSLKQALFVRGDGPDQLVLIDGEPEMFESPVRVGQGTADLRFRPIYDPWKATLTIDYLPLMLDEQSVVALVDAAGLGGVGEWRPSAPKSATGSYGRFEVVG
jgi:hypothetical protein